MAGDHAAYERRPSRRGSASFKGLSSALQSASVPSSPSSSSSSSSSSGPSMMRLLITLIVSLGLISISLQGYNVFQRQSREVIDLQVEANDKAAASPAQASLLRKPQEPVEDHELLVALAGFGEDPPEEAHAPESYPDVCYDERDWGLVDKIKESAKVYCGDSMASPHSATQVTVYNVTRGGFTALHFKRRFIIDLRKAQVHKPIKSIAQDGGRHDPRFVITPTLVQCECSKFADHAKQIKTLYNQSLELWKDAFGKMKKHEDPPSLACPAGAIVSDTGSPVVLIKEKTLLITRKDDHNPFFQVSNALNAWILIHALGWKRDQVRLIQLDGGYPSPIDDLHQRMLSPKFPIQKGVPSELLGKRIEFLNDVVQVPFETTGPMMQHLNDFEPCEDSKMMQAFRDEALNVMKLSPLPAKRQQITITVISRRNYGGRRVQRTLRNEKEILDEMRKLYPSSNGLPIVFQSIDFVNLTLQEQMQLMQSSDVVIGMHGAGMVNVFWTRPETLIVEIFPKRRHRWGYRNLCQFLGCDWHQFRGGKDTGKGQNNSHKMIPWEEWKAFFDPLFQSMLKRVAAEEASKTPPPDQAR